MIQTLPSTPENERAFLGALLLSGRMSDYADLPEGWFYFRPHQIIYQACRAAHQAGLPLDSTTLAPYLNGDLSLLLDLLASAPLSANLDHYADACRQHYQRRRVIEQANLAAQCAAAGDLHDAQRVLQDLQQNTDTRRALPYADLTDWWVVPEREWVFNHTLARDYVTVVASPGGAGKSLFAVGLIASLVTGVPIFPAFQPVGRQNVLYLSGEDDECEVRRRLAAYSDAHFRSEEYLHRAVQERLHLVAGYSRQFIVQTANQGYTESPYYESILAEVKRKRPALIIIDTLRKHLGPYSENDNAIVGHLLELCARLARTAHAAVLVLHHSNKGAADQEQSRQQDARGASAVIDEARSAFIGKRSHTGFKLTHAKSNYSVAGTVIDFDFVRLGQDGDSHRPTCLRQASAHIPMPKRPEESARLVAAWVADNPERTGMAGLKCKQYGLQTTLNLSTAEIMAGAEYAIQERWIIEVDKMDDRGRRRSVFIPSSSGLPVPKTNPDLELLPIATIDDDDELF